MNLSRRRFLAGSAAAAAAATLSAPAIAALPVEAPAVAEAYLPCAGQAVSRSVYAELFDVIGTVYGAGDGETTFNLPDLSLGPRATVLPRHGGREPAVLLEYAIVTQAPPVPNLPPPGFIFTRARPVEAA